MFYPGLALLCKRFFEDDHEAIEVLNNGMIKVFRNIRSFDPDKGSLFNWCYTIVRNAALDKLKKKKYPSVPFTDKHTEIASDDTPTMQLEEKAIYALLNVLEQPARVICSLFYMEGFSVKEIAQQLDLAEGTVKWYLHQARKKLKPVFEKHYG